MTMRFAVAPINWTNDDDPTLGGDISLERCLQEMKEAQFDACEHGNKFPSDHERLKQILKKFDLTMVTEWISTHFTVPHAFDHVLLQVRQRIDFLKKLNVKILKVCECGHAIHQSARSVFHNHVQFSREQWRLLINGLHEIGRTANEASMLVCYHHHLGTGVQSQDQLTRLMEHTDENLVHLLLDTGHLYAAGIDPAFTLSRYKNRVRHIHLKDVRDHAWRAAINDESSFLTAIKQGLFTVPGDGSIDFAPLYKILKQHDYDGYLVIEAEQDPKAKNPLLHAKIARRHLRRHLGQ